MLFRIDVKGKLIFIILLFSTLFVFPQRQEGGTLYGESYMNNFGATVSMNSDGTIMAVGAPYNNWSTGHVKIFRRSGLAWIQKGSTILGENYADLFGSKVALSSSGNTVVISAPKNNGSAYHSGHVRVYEWSGVDWIQKGIDIDGPSNERNYGTNIAINGLGNIIAINSGGMFGGYVDIFEWISGQWQLKGSQLIGEHFQDDFGFSISLNYLGNRVAVGARFNAGNGYRAGHVRVFDWINNQWTQIGNDLDGLSPGELFGFSNSLSDDGNTLAVGAEGGNFNGVVATGQIRVFTWNANQWIQKGSNVDGLAPYGRFGYSLSLDGSGNRFITGHKFHYWDSLYKGQVDLYQWKVNDWVKVSTILGKELDDHSGKSISLSSSGDFLSIGSPLNDDLGINAGLVRNYCFPTMSTEYIQVCDSFTWRDNKTYRNNTNTAKIVLTNSKNCDSLIYLNLTILSEEVTDYHKACDSFIWIDGNTYFESTTTPKVTYQNSLGCDSIVRLDLKILADSVSQIEVACDSFTWINGLTYTNSTNQVKYTTTNINGCDSVIYLDLTINKSISDTMVIEACDSIVWLDGISYKNSTKQPFYKLASALGCDSIIYLDLTINESELDTQNILACQSFTWIDGITYFESTGIPIMKFSNKYGCDSTLKLNLTITTVDKIISNQSNVLILKNQDYATYQWLDCSRNYTPVAQANEDNYLPNLNGSFACEIRINGCIDTTDCIVSNPEDLLPYNFKIYPNPTNEILTIKFSPFTTIESHEIWNFLGQRIDINFDLFNDKLVLDVKSFPVGTYFIRFEMSGKIETHKFIKY